VGYRFDPVFYDRRYWIDPYRYHLRPVAGWQRWVRYGPDILLVDIRNGRVLDVYSGFFL
jgi:Ni/Co efflux regulator RcnB